MKFEDSMMNIFRVFATPEWIAERIKTFPKGFVNPAGLPEFIRVAILQSGAGINKQSLSGILLIDIFTPVKSGPTRPAQLADKLDTYLASKCFEVAPGVSTQFSQGVLQDHGIDQVNTDLHRSVFSIPYTHTGVQP